MKCVPYRRIGAISYAALLMFSAESHAQSLETQAEQANQAGVGALREELNQRIKEIDALKRKLAEQEAGLARLSRALDADTLDTQRGTGGTDANGLPVGNAAPDAAAAAGAAAAQAGTTGEATSPAQAAQPAATQTAQQAQPVGQAPVVDSRPPAVAPIFDQPGVLTPRHTLVVEPYFNFMYSSENQLSLVGYTVIPALLIGLRSPPPMLARRASRRSRRSWPARRPLPRSTTATASTTGTRRSTRRSPAPRATRCSR